MTADRTGPTAADRQDSGGSVPGAEPAAPAVPPDDGTRLARASWSRLTEPGDPVAGALVAAMGPVEALAWVCEEAPRVVAGGRPRRGAPFEREAGLRLATAVARWAGRLASLDAERDLHVVERLGGHLLVPEDGGWPADLDDLGAAAPLCLWVRGTEPLGHLLRQAVAVVGARACTAYGEHVTADLAGGLADRGWTVLSGGAYGIDAVAHRAALAAGGPTVAVLAGGVDRPYPAGNARLLAAIADEGGAVVSEVAPGCVPSRTRFLQRNRLIAAAGRATVVVEAAWRSGALNTAGHAVTLLRPVGAVPGPVTSAASAGCHRLLRDAVAVCVTDIEEVVELAGAIGSAAAPPAVGESRPHDGLDLVCRRTLDALPLRRGATPESVARAAGLSLGEVRGALGRLEVGGLAVSAYGTWRRAPVAGRSGRTGTVRGAEP